MGRRIRKHANPFQVRTRLGVLDRRAIFGREANLEVELGCGNAQFLFERARHHPQYDFVGLEVRLPLVEAATKRREREGPPNVAVFYANAGENVRLAPDGTVRMFHVHFPDPCFKKRHWKRRILQPSIVRIMAQMLPIGGLVYAQSDVLPLAEEMFEFLRADGAFESRLDPGLLSPRPIEEATPWERQHEAEGEPIYRMLFQKIREPSGDIPTLPFRHTDPKKIAS
jgi:tRNA (guanine-N7-)-methyltransferase